ncbi:Equilibrative nucleoside transporter - like 3 [Theobroma cacao]|uniref:Nucleoside transporter, putative n=1 Tax=Theobroma cacao TaxID=3641 RepID=A0A061E5W7_THECC|nr:Nucleoside transporter, putative [Theobroma cacao]WRX15154.1 Equilibrative nucleoside transporter - like 2 [Theobroma cacao]WRX15459.1 Equilibrative nucleoside transporter - like 3 [Theobroma cacao]
MVFSGVPATDGGLEPDSESAPLVRSPLKPAKPEDKFHLAYIIYFTLGVGFLLPWNVFITAVDYFSYLYPEASVDRVFAVVYMLIGLGCLLIIVFYAHKSEAYVRINVGLGLFVVSLLVVPVMDAVYIRGRVGLYDGFYVTVVVVGLAGVADALVQGGLIGAAGELPERYMQAIVAGTAGSGVLVSVLRILTKAVFPQDADGLRKSANLYFSTSIVVMVICIVLYNVAHRLPIMKYYKELKMEAVKEEKEEKGPLTGPVWRAALWNIVGTVKWYGFGIILIYVVTLSIFPGYITEDVHSLILRDWYPVLLITGYNVFDLVGKSLTAVYLLENTKVAIAACVVRLLFFPLFIGCLHGPQFFRTEIPVSILTCLLGLTNGYLTSVLMILAPKSVQIQHAETAGIVMVLFLVIGLASGSVIAWFWVI